MAETKAGPVKSETAFRNTLAPLPETRRGYPTHLYAITQKPSKLTKGGDKLLYGNGRSVVIRDLDDPSKATTFTEHKGKVMVAQFSPNGEWVASGDDEGKVIVWSVATQIIKQNIPIGKAVYDLCWDSEGKRIVAVGDGAEQKAKVFAWDTGNNVGTIDFHSKSILSVSYRQQRPFRIVTGGEDLLVNFYEGPPFKYTKKFTDHDRYPNVVRYSPDGAQFISIGSDSKIIVYDGTTGNIVKKIADEANGHKAAIFSFAWSPDCKQIVTASADRTAKIWNIEAGNVTTTFTFPASTNTVDDQQMGALWHGKHIVTLSLNGQLNYLDAANPSAPKLIVQGHKENITGAAYEAKSNLLWAADLSGRVARWDMATGAATWFTNTLTKTVTGVAISSDGQRLATVSLDDKIRINETKEMKFSTTAIGLPGRPIAIAAANTNGNTFAVITESPSVVIIKDGVVGEALDLAFAPLGLAFSVDDSELAITGKANAFQLYSVNASGSVAVKGGLLEGPVRNVNAAAYSPDGAFVVAVDAHRRVSVYDKARTLKTTEGWQYHSSNVNDAVFSPNSKRLATCSMDESIIIYNDLTTFVPEKRYTLSLAHTGGVARVFFTNDNTIVSVGMDRSIKLWEIPELA